MQKKTEQGAPFTTVSSVIAAGMIARILTGTAAVFLVILLIFAVPSFREPQFEIVNESPELVTVVASWANQEKIIGSIPPMSSHPFRVNDEASMTFTVLYAGHRKVESQEFYFTRGTEAIVTISNNGIEVRYDSETQ